MAVSAETEIHKQMTIGWMQVPQSVSTRGWDAIVHQVWWCAAFQTPMKCHCELEKYAVENVETVKFIMQYLTQAAMELPSTSDNYGCRIRVICYPGTRPGSLSGTRVPKDKYLMDIIP